VSLRRFLLPILILIHIGVNKVYSNRLPAKETSVERLSRSHGGANVGEFHVDTPARSLQFAVLHFPVSSALLADIRFNILKGNV
jgi:hypothetical protein